MRELARHRAGFGPSSLRLLGAAVIGATLPTCTLISDFSVTACETHSDCASVEAEVAYCEQGRCVLGCTSNQLCADRDPRFPICTEPGGRCVGLLTPEGECYAAAGYEEALVSDLTARDLILLGAFAPSSRTSSWLTLELGVDELNAREQSGADDPRSRVVAVSCSDTASTIDVAIDHLVGELGVTALVASLEDIALRAALERPATRDRALYLNPNGFDEWSSPPEAADPLMWYLGPNHARVVPGYPPFLERALVAFERSGGSRDTFRMAMVQSDAREDRDLAAAVIDALGVDYDVARLLREGRMKTFEASSVQQDPAPLLGYQPQLLLFFAGGLNGLSPYPERASLLQRIEGTAPDFRPLYVFGPRNLEDVAPATLAAQSESFRRRAIGLTAERPIAADRAAVLVERFQEHFPELPAELQLHISFGVYDALNYLASASGIPASALRPRTAAEVAANLQRITDPNGVRMELSTPWHESASVAASPTTLNLLGTSGPAEFEADHARSGPLRIFCWGSDGVTRDIAGYDPDSAIPLPTSNCAQDFSGLAEGD
jgi:hypothetical protein